MNIVCENDAGAPQSFYDDEARAVQILDAAFPNDIRVVIKVGYGNYNGQRLQNQSISEGNVADNVVYLTYTQLRTDLLTFGEPGFFNNQNLPPFNDPNSPAHTKFWISSSEAKAFGIATTGTIDGYVGIGTNFVAGNERVSAFLHEIGHALGRVPGNFTQTVNGVTTTYSSALDLWRFTSNGNRYFDPNNTNNTPAYFSTDGGLNHLADWGEHSDASDFLNPSNTSFPPPYSNLTPNDPFDELVGNFANLTNIDLLITEALGFRRTPPGPPPPAPNPAPPPGTTADMILRHGSDGVYYIYDIGNNSLLASYKLGQVGTDFRFAGLGGFFGNDTTDMLLRNTSGAFYVYDISNNKITGAASLGSVGVDWNVMGFGNFSSFPRETDMMLRRSSDGAMLVYDIRNNQIVGSSYMGTVGLDWQFAGFGNFSSRGTSDMMLRNVSNGALLVYDINNNHITGAASMGVVGLDWKVLAFGDFSSRPGATDMIMRRSSDGAMLVYDINNNQITSSHFLGRVGSEWQFAGVAPARTAGESDLVLRNVNTGQFEVYDIAGNALVGAANLGAVGLDWQLGGFATDLSNAFLGGSGSQLGSADSTSQLVQAMAGFGGGAADISAAAPIGADTSQQTVLTAPQHA
jgi:hypothetical protein